MSSHILAFCLKIETAEGTVGFSSFDCDLEIEGIVYQANYSIDSFAGSSEVNLSVDNGEIKQLLDGLQPWSEARIAAGYLSSNRIALRLFNPLDLPSTFAEGVPIISGTTGKVKLIDGSYTFEIRSISELTNRPITEKTSPKCPYVFGDSRCTLDLPRLGLQYNLATVTAVSGDFGSTLTVDVVLSDRFVNGNVTSTSGDNLGLDFVISEAFTDTITVAGEFGGDFQVGDTLSIRAFCQKDQTACQFYNNFINFGNVPVGGNFVPGLTRITVIPN